jgi:capsular exopolysaccharide synthesis family protein
VPEKKFDVHENISKPAEEAYRVLRTNIGFVSLNNKVKLLSIVSPSHGDGKTTTSINLAISMATSGTRVLLIDADLRKPVIYKHFAGEQVLGLADVIAGKIDFHDAVSATEKENFYMLSSGSTPPFPTEFLTSPAFDAILDKAIKDYDFVIIDTPAMASYIDGAVIASKTDGVLIVVKHERAYYRSVLQVKKQLEKANAKMLGIILNKVSKRVYKNYYITDHDYGNLKKSFQQ